MDKKILSFEEYAANKNLANTDKLAEDEIEIKVDGEYEIEVEKEDEDEKEAEAETEETEETEEETEEVEEVEEAEEEKEEVEKIVSEIMTEAYESVVKEACQYHGDDYPDHTLESYLKENAALVATLTAQSAEDAHVDIHDGGFTKEAYEACLNDIKESYNKKIEELKEMYEAK